MRIRRDLINKISKVSLIVILTFVISGVSVKQMTLENDQKIIETYVANTNTNVEKEESDTQKLTALDEFLLTNEETLRFYSNFFEINYDTVIFKIKEANPNPEDILPHNIGRLNDRVTTFEYNSVDRGILEYFLNLEDTNPELFLTTQKPYTGSREYAEALVEYFSSLYPNVDHKVMLSIGAAESGYYTAQSMLAKNNVYGGMKRSGGLITYKNIEYGIMSYIKKMSDSYYDRGLNTVQSIGYVFNPVVTNGHKTANPHWLNLVNKALGVYTSELRYVSTAQLNDLLNNEGSVI